jgi:putative colanic acid biosynthesis acetyltransferase WcaF
MPAAEPVKRLRTLSQADAYSSPWTLGDRSRMLLWRLAWLLLFRPTPKPLLRWRLGILKFFGATIHGSPFVSPSARIRIPWHLTMHDHACLGEHAEVYNLGHVILRERCVIAQYAYLCGGSHDLTTDRLPLTTGPIDIGADAFLGARCFILPGVHVGEGAVVAATATVTRDVEPWAIVAGNPARFVKRRVFHREAAGSGPQPSIQSTGGTDGQTL